jgi:hypothetical protein
MTTIPAKTSNIQVKTWIDIHPRYGQKRVGIWTTDIDNVLRGLRQQELSQGPKFS